MPPFGDLTRHKNGSPTITVKNTLWNVAIKLIQLKMVKRKIIEPNVRNCGIYYDI